tara:strand:- start:319 stop:825 length:507 start_codon:yes stop_codon:yes gene_type:complete
MSEVSKNPNLQSRSPAQLAILAQAREKAKIVRSDNAKLKAQEREVIKLEKEQEKIDKKKNIADRMNKLKPAPVVESEVESDNESEVEVEVPKPKPTKAVVKKKKKQRVVEVSDSDEEEEEEIVYVKKAKPKRIVYREEAPVRQAQPPKPEYRYIKAEHADLYKRMFSI